MEKYEKLVRDRMPEILDAKGVPYEKRVANDSEYKAELIKKLNEEVSEFLEESSVEELADVLEVIDALKDLSEYQGVNAIQKQKRDERGGFSNRYIVKGEK